MTRTGLDGVVPTVKLCREMAAIPALQEAFKKSVFAYGQWDKDLWTDSSEPRCCGHELQPVELVLCDNVERLIEGGFQSAIVKNSCTVYRNVYAAPTCQEMLAWLVAQKMWSVARGSNDTARIVLNKPKTPWFGYDIAIPDDLALACLAMCKPQRSATAEPW